MLLYWLLGVLAMVLVGFGPLSLCAFTERRDERDLLLAAILLSWTVPFSAVVIVVWTVGCLLFVSC